MKEYRVMVIERHIDYVWITAESKEEAESIAHNESQCDFHLLEEVVAVEEHEI